MSKVIFYVAASLDMLIADDQGGVDWLQQFSDGTVDYGFHQFLDSVDTVMMGSKTYQQILSFGTWPYQGKRGVVFTKQKLEKMPNAEITFESTLSPQVMAKHTSTKNSWLVGGGQLFDSMRRQNLVHELQLFIMPITLGKGIPLFASSRVDADFKLSSTQSYDNGVVELQYNLISTS